MSAGKKVDDQGNMSLIGHLKEIRNRIAVSVLVLIVAFFACFAIIKPLANELLMMGLNSGFQYVYLSPSELLTSYFKLALILAVVVSSLVSSGTSFIKLVADPNDQLPAITYWLMGSLNGTTPEDVFFVVWPMLLGLVPLFLLRWRVNILTLGDEEAKTMGVNAKRLRTIVILCATLITAASVSVSGMIGWVGLVIPHLTRRVVGNNYKYLMPASMLFGAIFLLLVDDISRNLLATEIPIGILTSMIGAPFFLYLMSKDGDQL